MRLVIYLIVVIGAIVALVLTHKMDIWSKGAAILYDIWVIFLLILGLFLIQPWRI